MKPQHPLASVVARLFCAPIFIHPSLQKMKRALRRKKKTRIHNVDDLFSICPFTCSSLLNVSTWVLSGRRCVCDREISLNGSV